MIREILLITALAIVAALFVGCHTVQGIGRDITSVGYVLEDVVH